MITRLPIFFKLQLIVIRWVFPSFNFVVGNVMRLIGGCYHISFSCSYVAARRGFRWLLGFVVEQ